MGARSGNLPVRGSSYKRLFWLLEPAFRTSIFMILPSAPLPIGDLLWIYSVLLDVATEINEDILIVMYALTCSYSYMRIAYSAQSNSLHDDVVAAGTVAYIHVDRCSSC